MAVTLVNYGRSYRQRLFYFIRFFLFTDCAVHCGIVQVDLVSRICVMCTREANHEWETRCQETIMGANIDDRIILKVYLDSSEERTAEVPITPQTTCADVLACCREPGEQHCHLAELWRGCERVIAAEERLYDILHQWGIHRDEVCFFLRHEAALTHVNMHGHRIPKKNGLSDTDQSNMLPTSTAPGGGGADLTLAELQEMAARQQHQIQTQQQILVAKEQRLKFLKQQEMRHHQIASENERLRKLREKVEAQELKLKKLRVLRGQVDTHKSNNANFTSELDAIRGLFNEKEKELAVAVAKVEELTKQLEQVQKGRGHHDNNILNTPAMMELEKLRKELAMRNKLNEQQNSKLNASRHVLSLKKDEVAAMDKRIAELQSRLQKKRLLQQEHRNNLANQKKVSTGSISPHQRVPSSNIAAVEPYIKHAPKEITKDDMFSNQDLKAGFSLGKSDPKYQTLPYNTKFPANNDAGKKMIEDNLVKDYIDGKEDYHKPKVTSPNNNSTSQAPGNKDAKQPHSHQQHPATTDPKMPDPARGPPPTYTTSAYDAASKNRIGFTVKAPTCFANLAPRPFGSTYSTAMITNRNNVITTNGNSLPTSTTVGQFTDANGQVPTVSKSVPVSSPNKVGQGIAPEITVTGPSPQRSSPEKLGVYTSGAVISAGSPVSQYQASNRAAPPVYKVSSHPTTVIQPQQTEVPVSPPHSPSVKVPDRVTVTPPRGPMTSTPIAQGQMPASTPQTTFSDTPTSGNLDTRPLPGQFTVTNSTKVSLSERQTSKGQTSETPMNGSRHGQGVMAASPDQHASDGKDTVDTSPNAVSSALSVLMGSTTTSTTTAAGASKPTYRYAPKSVIANTYMRKMGTGAIDQYRKNMTALYKDFYPHGVEEGAAPDKTSPTSTSSSSSSSSQSNNNNSPAKPDLQSQSDDTPSRPDPPPYPGTTRAQSPQKMAPPPYPGYRTTAPRPLRRRLSVGESDDVPTSPRGEGSGNLATTDAQVGAQISRVSPQRQTVPPVAKTTGNGQTGVVMRRKKTNLKSKDSARSISRRVSFDPLALLLDASLEGELELVKRTAAEVPNPSAANDEGITALHNAICAGHYDIVTFLVQFGCDANAPDSDGWTPLHCAASCNNLPMVKFLVEHGACIFATTISDAETAAEKCEEDEDGYDGCSEFLYSVQEKLGILNGGMVYAVYDYAAENNDELAFRINDQLTVLRKGDDRERDWWWTRRGDTEGYVPRNLLGLYPRVLPRGEESQAPGSAI